MKKIQLTICVLGAALCLGGCGKTEERMEAGLAQLEAGEYEEAAETFAQAYENRRWYEFADRKEILRCRGEALMGQKDFAAALKVYEGLGEDDPENALYPYNAGLARYGLEEYQEAEEAFLKAAGLGKEEALEYAGRAAYRDGRYEEAESHYRQALEKNPKSSRLYLQIAVCKMGSADYQGALEILEEAIAGGDTEALQQLLYQQAVCYEYMGQYETARDKLEAYIRQYPGDEAAEKEYAFLLSR